MFLVDSHRRHTGFRSKHGCEAMNDFDVTSSFRCMVMHPPAVQTRGRHCEVRLFWHFSLRIQTGAEKMSLRRNGSPYI